MSYETQANVLIHLGANGVLSATTRPTPREAEIIQTGIAAEIDVTLAGQGVVTPVVAAGSLLDYLKRLEMLGTCAGILKVRFQDSAGPNTESLWSFYQQQYRDGLAAIRAGQIVQGLAGSGGLPGSYLTRNPDTEEDLGDLAVDPFGSTFEW